MTATAPSTRTDASGRADALRLAAALLLAASGLFALPAELFSQAYYSDSWSVAAVAAPASVLPVLVLVAAAVARGSRVLLLVTSALTVLHLVAMVALAAATAGGPESPLTFLSGQVELGLALVGLALGWWDTSRAERRPGIALAVVALVPVAGLVVEVSQIGGGEWWLLGAGALALQQFPAFLTVLAAGLVCLPGRGARIAAATLIGLAGLSLFGADPVLDAPTQLPLLRLAALAVALVCAAVAVVAARPGEPAAGSVTPLVPEAVDRPGTDTDAGAAAAGAGVRVPALAVAALVTLVVTAALNVPEMFAYGPGIRPAGAGLIPLLDLVVDACVLAALVLTAGAVTSGSRALLVGASVLSGFLALVLLISRAGGGTAGLYAALPFVALGLSLAAGWTSARRTQSDGAPLRWAAVLPLMLAASPLQVFADPAAVRYYFGDPTFAPLHLLPTVLFGVAPVLAAALIGFPRRGTRVAAAVLLGLLALAGIGATLESTSGLRLLVALHLLRAGGYALACVLVVSATLTPRRGR
jgi:hypothetical protein